jgi:hypothetical protein
VPAVAASPTASGGLLTIHIDASLIIPVLSIAAGIAVLVMPRSTKYIIAGYLIAFGVVKLLI